MIGCCLCRTIFQGGIGNLIALPLQGQALKEGNSAFIDENWNAYPDQWQVLFSKPKLSKEFVEEKIKEWKIESFFESVEVNDITDSDGEKPWDKSKHFVKTDVEGILNITLSNGIYINTSNLKPRIQNRIREMAAFRNPAFYKNQAETTQTASHPHPVMEFLFPANNTYLPGPLLPEYHPADIYACS